MRNRYEAELEHLSGPRRFEGKISAVLVVICESHGESRDARVLLKSFKNGFLAIQF